MCFRQHSPGLDQPFTLCGLIVQGIRVRCEMHTRFWRRRMLPLRLMADSR